MRNELLEDIKRIKIKLGHTPSLVEYRDNGGKYGRRSFRTHFGSWSKALVALGIQPKTNQFVTQPNLPLIKYNKVAQLEIDSAIAAYDFHVPYHNVNLCNEMLDFANKQGIKVLITDKDVFEFTDLYIKDVQDSSIDWVDILGAVRDFFHQLLEVFDEIHVMGANHGWRLSRFFNSNEKAEKLFNLMMDEPRIKFYQQFYILLNYKFYVTHSKFTKQQLSKLKKLANVHRKSIISGHSHRFAFGVNDCGIEVIGEGLHMTDPHYHEYKYRELTDHSEWVPGFWIFKDNQVAPYVKHPKVLNPWL